MCLTCNGHKHTHTEVVGGVWQVTPCDCLPDWETVRKPQLEKLLKEAEDRGRNMDNQKYRAKVSVS